jgi:hypothetical protein
MNLTYRRNDCDTFAGSAAEVERASQRSRASWRRNMDFISTTAMIRSRRTLPAQTQPITPMLYMFLAMTMDERWVKRTPEEMFRTFHGFHGEGFGLILEDLLDLPTNVPVLVEGYKLLPRLVAPLLSRPDQAVWLIPTPEWRRTALSRRGSLWSIAGHTSDPETALAHLLARDALYTEEVFRQATALHLTLIEVSGSTSLDELATRVAQGLGIRRQ